MNRTLITTALSAAVALAGIGLAPTPAPAAGFEIIGWADWQSVQGRTSLNCHVAVWDASGTPITDPGAQVTIDECAIYRGYDLLLTSPALPTTTGPVGQTVPVVGEFGSQGIVGCFTAHAVLSSGDTISKRQCF